MIRIDDQNLMMMMMDDWGSVVSHHVIIPFQGSDHCSPIRPWQASTVWCLVNDTLHPAGILNENCAILSWPCECRCMPSSVFRDKAAAKFCCILLLAWARPYIVYQQNSVFAWNQIKMNHHPCRVGFIIMMYLWIPHNGHVESMLSTTINLWTTHMSTPSAVRR